MTDAGHPLPEVNDRLTRLRDALNVAADGDFDAASRTGEAPT